MNGEAKQRGGIAPPDNSMRATKKKIANQVREEESMWKNVMGIGIAGYIVGVVFDTTVMRVQRTLSSHSSHTKSFLISKSTSSSYIRLRHFNYCFKFGNMSLSSQAHSQFPYQIDARSFDKVKMHSGKASVRGECVGGTEFITNVSWF